MTIGTWLAVGELGWVIGLGTWIVLERRSPAATLAWIFGLAWIPLLGIPVYLLIGPRRLRRKKLRYRRGKTRIAEASESLERERGETAVSSAEWNSPLALLAQRAGQPRPQAAKRIDFLTSGNVCYESIEAAIASAKHHVHLEYYIWEPDRIGARFRDLLCEKAKSGVEVRLLIDAIGSRRLNRRFLRPLRDSGAELARFNPISIMRYPPGLVNFRTHRKICVVDGEIGFLGGVNICDSHSETMSGELAWRDTHLRIEGPPVGDMQLAFLEDWQFANGGGPCSSDYFPLSEPPSAGPPVQILTSGPDHESYAIERFFFGAIAGARNRILLTTPYFVPNEGILSALTTSAMRGVEVRILVPKRSDSRLVTAAARSYFEDLARRGVMIHEYRPRMLHAKTMVVDDDVSIVGTANMDNRSFRLNFEIAAVIYDRELADSLSANFAEDLRYASEYRLRDARRTPFAQRLGESAARLLSPLL
jgi:cardiolipin synthase